VKGRPAEADKADVVDFPSLAAHFGISEFAAKVWLCAGMPGGSDFCPHARNLDKLAAYFKVNRRTAAEWRDAGMPQEPDGTYNLVAVRDWRMNRPDPPPGVVRGSAKLAGRKATGNLTRALFRLLRLELVSRLSEGFDAFLGKWLPDASEAETERLRAGLVRIVGDRLRSLCLDEDEVEKLIADCAFMV